MHREIHFWNHNLFIFNYVKACFTNKWTNIFSNKEDHSNKKWNSNGLTTLLSLFFRSEFFFLVKVFTYFRNQILYKTRLIVASLGHLQSQKNGWDLWLSNIIKLLTFAISVQEPKTDGSISNITEIAFHMDSIISNWVKYYLRKRKILSNDNMEIH